MLGVVEMDAGLDSHIIETEEEWYEIRIKIQPSRGRDHKGNSDERKDRSDKLVISRNRIPDSILERLNKKCRLDV